MPKASAGGGVPSDTTPLLVPPQHGAPVGAASEEPPLHAEEGHGDRDEILAVVTQLGHDFARLQAYVAHHYQVGFACTLR